MPYIFKSDRERLNPVINSGRALNAGQLNFQITLLCDEYLRHKLTYNGINEVIGALECAKLELYRRIAVPYERWKIEENGDVYSPHNIIQSEAP